MAVAVLALAAGFLIGTRQAGVHTDTGRADSTAHGGGTIFTDDWAYGFAADVPWTDAANTRHEGDTPACLPPLSSVDGIRFAYVEVTVEGATFRPVVWVDCRGIPLPSPDPSVPAT